MNLDALQVTVGERSFEFEPSELDADDRARATVLAIPTASPEEGSGQTRWEVVVDGWRFEVAVESAARARLRERAGHAGESARAHASESVVAQIPGRIVGIFVSAGDDVETGQRLVSLEAMKMENEIRAPRAGRIARVSVSPGQRVELGEELAVLE